MCNLKKHITCALFFVLPVLCFAQLPATKIYKFSTEEKTPKILTLYQNKQGYILAGTTNGLYRFDGINFFRYTQDAAVPLEISAIFEAKNGLTWIGFNNGELGFLENNKIVLQHPEEGHPSVCIKKIIEDDAGVIWIATAGEGLYYYFNNKYFNINMDDGLSDNYIYTLAYKKNTGILAGTDRGVNICKLTNGKKQVAIFTSKNGLPDNIVRSISTTKNNFVWLGMQDGGICTYTPSTGACKGYTTPIHWSYGQVNDLITFNDEVWVATEDNGLLCFKYDENGKILSLLKQNNSFKRIYSLLQDKEGNIWAANNDQLMRTIGPKLQPIYTFQSASYDDLHTILYAKNGNFWFNKNQNLVQLTGLAGDKWKEREYRFESIAPRSDITSLYQDEKGFIWIGTMGSGVIILDPESGKHRTLTEDSLLVNSSILAISGKNNIIWIASLQGVVACKEPEQYNNVSQKFQCTDYNDEKTVGSNYVYDIFTDSKNRTWFATDGKGISLLSNNVFTHYNQSNGFNSDVVYKIAEDGEANLWFCTLNNGVIKYNGKQFTNYGLAEGLSDLNITSIALAGNYLLAAHKNGIDLINTNSGIVSYLNDEQGLSNINTDIQTFTKDNSGNVYFLNDYTIFKYQTLYQIQQKPSLVIDRVQLFLKDTMIQSGHAFNSEENNISFFFTGLFYSHPEKIQYQFKLEGFDENWMTTKDRVKNFPKLPPGSYTFKVRASLNKNFSHATETSFKFTINPPFYTTWWFIIICFITAIMVLYFFVKGRDKRLQKWSSMEQEKIHSQLETLRSQINPHFLFNSFNTLIAEIETHPDNAVTYVEHLSDFYRSIVLNREKNLIPLQEELDILKNYFFIQQKRYGDALKIEVNISPAQATIYVITPLALQLLIENAIKHNMVSTETPLFINLFIDDKDYLVIKNNINKKLHPETGGNLGLQNIQRRYQILSKRVVVIENDEKNFTVKIPLITQ